MIAVGMSGTSRSGARSRRGFRQRLAGGGRAETAGDAELLDVALQLEGIDLLAMGDEAAGDGDFAGGAAGLDAQGGGRQLHHHALDEGVADAAEGLDAAADGDAADGLADLDADGAIGAGDDALELRVAHGARVDVEAAGAEAEGFDGGVDPQRPEGAEIDEADAARAEGGDLGVGVPAVHGAPIVEHHVVRAVGGDRAAITDAVDEGAVAR